MEQASKAAGADAGWWFLKKKQERKKRRAKVAGSVLSVLLLLLVGLPVLVFCFVSVCCAGYGFGFLVRFVSSAALTDDECASRRRWTDELQSRYYLLFSFCWGLRMNVVCCFLEVFVEIFDQSRKSVFGKYVFFNKAK